MRGNVGSTLFAVLREELAGLLLAMELVEVFNFGWSFDSPIDHFAWPSSVRKLAFGTRFNQRIEGTALPPSL